MRAIPWLGAALWACASAASAAPGLRLEPPAALADVPEYTVRLAVSDLDRSVRGTVRITLLNPLAEPLTALPMVLPPDIATPGALTVDAFASDPPATLDSGLPSELKVTFERPVPPGAPIALELGFRGAARALPSDTNDLLAQSLGQLGSLRGGGQGSGDFGLLAAGDGILVAANALPMVVPVVDGAFASRVLRPGAEVGDLSWNAPARIHARIETPLGLRVVTSGVDGPVHADGSTQWIEAEASYARDFAVVAARDWVVAERDVGGVRVRSWARARDRAAGAAVLDAGASALRFDEARYGRYPWTELDLVEASLIGGAGGVEFGGLALIAGFLYRDPASPDSVLGALLAGLGAGAGGTLGGPVDVGADLAEQRRFVVAHEVAHQWSPGVVGADAWNQPIVDEPLAQYLAWRATTEGLAPAEAADRRGRFVTAGYGALRLAGGDDDAAARATSGFPSSLAYGGLVYGKAPGLYFALEASVGRERLDRALRAAFAARAWTTVDADGWLASLEAGGATGAVALGQRWWREAHGDEDLGLDPRMDRALDWLLGVRQAQAMRTAFAPLGLDPAGLFGALFGRPPGAP